MKKRAFKAAGVGLIAGLGLFVGATPASADGPSTSPQEAQSSASGDGVLSGNSAAVPVAIPIGVCGNAVGAGAAVGLGGALGICELGLFSSVSSPDGVTAGPQQAESNAEGDGVLSGNSIVAPIAAPVDICGNAVGLGVAGIGLAGAACEVSLFSS